MADYKNYIVRYDIQADVTKAAEGLRSIANIAKEFAVPMDKLSTAIKQVSQSVFQLKQNANITFAPTIDTGAFNSQLRNMVVQVEDAAAKMHAAIFQALSGNANATKAMQKGISTALKSDKSISDLKKDIAAYNKELDKLLGTPITKKGKTTRERDGAIQMAKNAKLDGRVVELKSRQQMFQKLIKQRRAELALAEQLEKETSTKQTKGDSKTKTQAKGASVSSAQAAKLTNVTPAVIREWKKAFEDAKNKALTVKIIGNAGGINGALTVIQQVQSSLEALQAKCTFNISPVLNMEAFAAAEAQLKRLAGLASSITAPFIAKGEQAQGSKLGSPIVSLTKDEKSKLSEAKKQVKAWNEKIANVQSRLDANKEKYDKAPTPGLKGQITRDIKTLEKYQAGRAEQEKIVKSIQRKTSNAVQSSAKNIKPFSIDVIGNLKGVNLSGKIPTIPVNVKIMSGQVTESIKSISRPTMPVSIKLLWDKGAIGRQEQLKNISSKIPPVTLNLDTKAAIAKFEEFISLIKSNSVQNIQLTASGKSQSTITNTIAPSSFISGNKNNTIAKNKPLTAQERYAKLKENAIKNAEKAKAGGKQMILKGREVRAKEQAWRAQQQAMYNRLFEAVPKPDYGWLRRQESQRSAELLKMREDARAAFAKPTPFEQKEMSEQKRAASNSLARHQQKAARLRAQAYNSMLPFAQNKEQAKMMAKYRKYFRQAIATTGITPTQGMDASQMLRYLQSVSNQMQSSSVAVPWQLQSQINKLQGQIAKSTGIASGGSSLKTSVVPINDQKSFFDRSRKWAYPFTGQTSFGARTPMAVDMAKGMGVMFAIGGAMSAIGSSFSQAMEYQNIMRTTEAILQHGTDSYTKSSFKNMENTVRDVGVKTKFSAPEVADAAKFLAMAGYDIEAINASIRPIADLALIGDSDLGETADKMTNIMTTFQIRPEKMREAANIMATTATRSNTDLMMLAESAKYGGGVANMYGRNDPNLFADTMALFGVMGNAGVQASSAGTALRMMYQNIFKPNKNQKAVLDIMEKDYGITTTKKDGGYRAMSDILIDMAQRIPENRIAEIVGKLFRITAQPGATATLLAAAGGDANIAQEIGVGIEALSNKMSNKTELSELLSLMRANRESMNGNISGSTAEKKQNTIQGLWAQVTSTFTEGIVQSFEQRQGGFESMLRQLRDYFAKPETIQMMQNLLDMIVEIGKVMAWFVKIWAELYNIAPGIVKNWVIIQMFFTQMGTLIAPVIQLISVFNRLNGVISKLAGVSIVGGTVMTKATSSKMIAGSTASSALYATPFFIDKSNVIRGKAAVRANRELASNAILAGELALSGASKRDTLNTLNNQTRQRYAEIKRRANNIYGAARAKRVFNALTFELPTMATFAPMITGMKRLFIGLLTSLAKSLVFLLNPLTLVTTAFGAFGLGAYKLYQFVNGNTEAQVLAQQEMAKKSAEATRAMVSNFQWYKEQLDKYKHPAQPLESPGKSEKQLEYEGRANTFKSENVDILADITKNASSKGTNQQVASWRKRINSNPLAKFAMGKDYYKFVGDEWSENNPPKEYWNKDANFGAAFYFAQVEATEKAKRVQNNQIQVALRIAGANHPTIQNANEQITNLRQQFLDGSISESEYYDKAYKIRDNIVNLNDPRLRPSAGMTLEQFKNISDPSIFREYAIGQYNILNSLIKGEYGSLVGQMNAENTLRNGVEMLSDSWLEAIRHVIGNFPIDYSVASEDGQRVVVRDLRLSMLPDGKIDTQKLVTDIKDKVDTFNGNLTDFAYLYTKVYMMMAEAGLVPEGKENAKKWTLAQLQNQPISSEDAASFYHNDLSNNSDMKKYTTVEEYQKYIANPNGKLTINGKSYLSSNSATIILNTLVNKAVEKLINDAAGLNNKTNQMSGSDGSGTSTTPPPTGSVDQNEYASRYNSTSARPTQININIDKLAHFDRTTVASSAEERDLVEAMETKITEAVYRIFAEASNQAQSVIDLT